MATANDEPDRLPDRLPERAAPRRLSRGAVAVTFSVFVVSLFAVFVALGGNTPDRDVAVEVASFASVVSGAVLMLQFALPFVGRERLVEEALGEPLDDESLALLDRATDAIDAIAASRAQQRGFLDGIANSLVLQEQTAEITAKLEVLSGLRRGEREIGATSPEALARLKRQQTAIDGAAASLTRRVEALESYAGQVAELDALLHETTVMARLDERDALIAELLAETARDQPAVEDVDRLARGLPAAADQLEQHLRAVRERGQFFLDTD